MIFHFHREDDWKSMARSKLRQFEEELHVAHEAGMTSYSGLKAWTFINSVIYCMTVLTTIGAIPLSPSLSLSNLLTKSLDNIFNNFLLSLRLWTYLSSNGYRACNNNYLCSHWYSHFSHIACRFW